MKKIVRRTLVVVIGVAILFCQVTNVIVQFRLTQRQMVANTRELFWQVGQILEENQEELETVTEEFSVQCIQKAKLFSNILRNNPGVLEDQTELRRIVELVEVDEVHVFNDEGLLYAGSEPKYYGFTFNSGEQMQFFLPMLTDKHLEMCQNITPNTAEGKLMQYAAVWGESGENIIQIGMEPTRVMEARKKNELSYIFSLLSPDDRSVLCAVDPGPFSFWPPRTRRWRGEC